MALDNTAADALATAINTALGITDPASIAITKSVYRLVYSHLKLDVLITLPAASVVTVGSAATQTGPAAPVLMTPA